MSIKRWTVTFLPMVCVKDRIVVDIVWNFCSVIGSVVVVIVVGFVVGESVIVLDVVVERERL